MINPDHHKLWVFSPRVGKALCCIGISTMKELLQADPERIAMAKGLGHNSFMEILRWMKKEATKPLVLFYPLGPPETSRLR